MAILLLKELVDSSGARIRGDEPVNQGNNETASNSTTDDFIPSVRQNAWSRYTNYGRVGYMGEDDDTDVELPDEDKKRKKGEIVRKPMSKKIGDKLSTKIKMDKPTGKLSSLNSTLKETSKGKMDSLIEDIFTKKDFDKEFVNKKNSDIRLNGIQPLDTIKDTNPILIRKVQNLKELIEKNDATGEEKAIILNYLLGIDMNDIPQQYKDELKKRII